MSNPIPPYRKVLSSRYETTADNRHVSLDVLECGHEMIHEPFATERRCVQCADEAKYGKVPAPRPPRES